MVLDESTIDLSFGLEFQLEQLSAADATPDLATPGCSGCHRCAAAE